MCNAIDQRERTLYVSGRQYCAHIGGRDVVCAYGQDLVHKGVSVTGMDLVHALRVVRLCAPCIVLVVQMACSLRNTMAGALCVLT